MVWTKDALSDPPAEAENQSPDDVRSPLPMQRAEDHHRNNGAHQKGGGNARDNKGLAAHAITLRNVKDGAMASVRFPPIADIDDALASPHDGVVKRLIYLVALTLMLSALACSDGKASRSQQGSSAPPIVRVPASLPLTGRVTDADHILSPEQQGGSRQS